MREKDDRLTVHRVKFTGKGRDRKIRYLLRSYVCEHVELYFQGG